MPEALDKNFVISANASFTNRHFAASSGVTTNMKKQKSPSKSTANQKMSHIEKIYKNKILCTQESVTKSAMKNGLSGSRNNHPGNVLSD